MMPAIDLSFLVVLATLRKFGADWPLFYASHLLTFSPSHLLIFFTFITFITFITSLSFFSHSFYPLSNFVQKTYLGLSYTQITSVKKTIIQWCKPA